MAASVQIPVQKYLDMIAQYDAEFKKWEARSVGVLKKYRADNKSASGNEAAQFNILWSNVQTLVPAVYARVPKADVSRRFVDNDPVGRVASLLIERCLDYENEHYTDFRSAMHNSVEDRFLCGRGVSWVRYDPHVVAQEDAEGQITEDVPDPREETAGESPVAEKVDYECSPTDYVYWKDFGHSTARTWEEVTCVWRWVYMTEPALVARFGKKMAKKIPLDSGPQQLQRQTRGDKVENDRAKIAELWDKETGRVVWLSKHLPHEIDWRSDPLEVEGFFPCPRPLYATTTTDTLVPVPDFILYQDQANELNILSDRIDGLVKALRVRGIYDASQPALQRLLTEGDNNTLVGTDKWAAFSEKGGLKGSIDLLPIEIFASALLTCYQARADIKAQIFEITGISDIIRGQGAASETATAQQIKGQYAGLRLRNMQEGVAIFATELLRLKAHIICTKYQDETILAYAAASQMSAEDQQMIPDALQLLRSNPLRNFRIEVAADSLVQIDEQQTKQERLEFLNYSSTFLREAIPAGQAVPEMAPAIMAMLKFGIGGFKQAKTIEGTLDAALQKLMAKAAQAQANPQPSPEQQKLMAEQQKAQVEQQLEAQRMQAEQQRAQVEMQMEAQRIQMEAQAEAQRLQMEAHFEQQRIMLEQQAKAQEQAQEAAFQRWKAELDAAVKVEVANISAKATKDTAATQAADAEVAREVRP